MIRLLAAETVRLFSRRFTLVTLVGILLAVGAFQLLSNDSLTPPSAQEVTVAQRQLDTELKDWEANHEQYEKDCRDSSPKGTDCTYPRPTLDSYLYRPSFQDVVTTSMTVTVYLVALASFMIGGSFIGAEYGSGSIANWLSFIPRRGRVFASKLVTIAAFGAVLCAVLSALTLGVDALLAHAHGTATSHVPALAAMGARGVLVAVGMAALGFCFGMVSRHTAAAIGVMLGYGFVFFVRNAIMQDYAWAQRLTPWTPEGAIGAIVEKGHHYSVPVRTMTPDGVSYDYQEHLVSYGHGLVYWTVAVVVVVAFTFVVFRRRDVS